jgi:hypothetical protein
MINLPATTTEGRWECGLCGKGEGEWCPEFRRTSAAPCSTTCRMWVDATGYAWNEKPRHE